MADGDIEEFLFLFVIIFTKIVLWSLRKFSLHFTMDFQDKFILLNSYLYYLMHFGQVGLA